MNSDATVYHSRNIPPMDDGDLLRFSRKQAGWEWMSFAVQRVNPGRTLTLSPNMEETALILLNGVGVADWGIGERRIGSRASIFDGLPYALYLPHGSHATLRAETQCEIAECSVPSQAKLKPALITPAEVSTSLRGGENASRQIVTVIPPEFAADKLVAFEVYTPGGNWSSYPPHKHDTHNPPAEVDLDEIYYYRIKEASGYALQNLYNTESQRDTIVKARDGDAVLVRDGYHPVVAGPGYDTYYLNFLAGTSRTMAVTEDPNHVWLRDTWKQVDPRLPLVRG
jgi:5-deoxy-glucuronate isomerase